MLRVNFFAQLSWHAHQRPAIACLAVLLLLAGCAHRPPPPLPDGTQVAWLKQVRAATQLTDWRIHGKIGVKSGRDGGSAFIHWMQSGDSFHISLSGPLGQGTTIISGNDEGARLESSREGVHIADSAEQLLFEHTGWYLPLQSLLHWIKGLPEPSTPYQETRTPEGLIDTLIQGPWSLRFDRYAGFDANLFLPHRIRIQSQEWNVTLVVRNWSRLDTDNWNGATMVDEASDESSSVESSWAP